mgnify:CR=1 FL=1
MMVKIPAKHRSFLPAAVKSGRFSSVDRVVDAAITRFKDEERKIEELRRSLVSAAAPADRGAGIEWDIDREKARLVARLGGRDRRAVDSRSGVANGR